MDKEWININILQLCPTSDSSQSMVGYQTPNFEDMNTSLHTVVDKIHDTLTKEKNYNYKESDCKKSSLSSSINGYIGQDQRLLIEVFFYDRRRTI